MILGVRQHVLVARRARKCEVIQRQLFSGQFYCRHIMPSCVKRPVVTATSRHAISQMPEFDDASPRESALPTVSPTLLADSGRRSGSSPSDLGIGRGRGSPSAGTSEPLRRPSSFPENKAHEGCPPNHTAIGSAWQTRRSHPGGAKCVAHIVPTCCQVFVVATRR